MRVCSISILDGDFNLKYLYQTDRASDTDMILLFTSFVNGLSNFADELTSSLITRVDLNNYWLDFLEVKGGYVLILSSVDRDSHMSKRQGFSRIIEVFLEMIEDLFEKSPEFLRYPDKVEYLKSFIELNLGIIENTVHLDIPNVKSDKEWEIEMMNVSDLSGLPIHYKYYGVEPLIDPVIISGMLIMLNSFIKKNLGLDINIIHLENIKLIFSHKNERLYVVGISCSRKFQRILPYDVEKKLGSLLFSIGDALELMFELNPSTDEETIEEVFDTYALEAKDRSVID